MNTFYPSKFYIYEKSLSVVLETKKCFNTKLIHHINQ